MAHTPRCPSPLSDNFAGNLLHIMHRFFPANCVILFSPEIALFSFRLSHSILNFNQLKHQISHNMNRKFAFFQRDSAARCDFLSLCVCVCVWRRFLRVSTFMHSNFPTLTRVARGVLQGFLTKTAEGKKQKFVFVAYAFHAFPVRSCYCKGAERRYLGKRLQRLCLHLVISYEIPILQCAEGQTQQAVYFIYFIRSFINLESL